MCRAVSIYYSVVTLFLFLTMSAWAADDWCIEDPNNPPCNGAWGRCTRNADGSEGGFVAYSAYVESKRIWGWTTWFSVYQTFNIPKIGKYAQVCDSARVYGNAQVDDYANVIDDAQVYGNGKVYEHAQVRNRGRVYENGQVYGRSIVAWNGQVHGNAHAYGHSWVDGNVYGEAHFYNVTNNGATVYQAGYYRGGIFTSTVPLPLVRDNVLSPNLVEELRQREPIEQKNASNSSVNRKRTLAIEEELDTRKAMCISTLISLTYAAR